MQEYRVEIDSCGTERWFNKDDELHREDDKPAVIYADGARIWYQYDRLHRVDGPAATFADGSEAWYKNGKYHRIGGPAVIHADGYEEFWINGKRQPDPNDVKELTVAAIEELLGHRVKVVK
jgi:hypothetical protein